MIVPTEEPTWAVGLHKKRGGVYVRVTGWRISGNGVKPVINHERIPPGIRVLEVFRGTELDAAKVAALLELVEMTNRATNSAQFDVVERAAKWVMAYGEPRDA
ncbi:hypothetical protein ACIRU3_22165 [Streptomyces sp. NPDC101151]|uniref:hypothetical protein n=1 Tax=Streptomyces sp. NPDC101151 TaxID=3366115 RepID=UPI0037FD19E6